MNRLSNFIMNHVATGPQLTPEQRTEALAATLELVRKLGGVPEVEQALVTAVQAEISDVSLSDYVDSLRRTVGLKSREHKA